MIDITLPTLHSGQVAAYKQEGRFKAIRCGRRWGKTELGITIACDAAIKGKSFGVFAPDYKILAETFTRCAEILAPVKVNSSKIEGVIRLVNRGRIDFWTLNNPRAGRSRKYHGVLLDEVAFADNDMMDIWQKAIKPSLLDYSGSALALSTPNGADPDNFFYQICTDQKHGFVEYHAPTSTNPYLPADAVANLEKENTPLVFRQEYLAEFVDWSGAAFFSQDALLVNGQAPEVTWRTDEIFAVVDTALKDGIEHDATAVTWCASSRYEGHPLVILDWEIIQISGDLLTNWLPGVLQRGEELARQTRARNGFVGAWVEDKASGIVLIQHAQRRGWNVRALPEAMTAAGKEGRAVAVSGHVYQGKVKISRYAFDKVMVYKGQSRNHLLSQVCGFRLGQKTPHAQDLLDCACYSIAIALGDAKGF